MWEKAASPREASPHTCLINYGGSWGSLKCSRKWRLLMIVLTPPPRNIDIEIQFSGSIELNPRTISSVSKSLVDSLKEQHCCADWETLLTFNLSCFKKSISYTADVRQKQTALSRSKGQAGRNYRPISWSAHTQSGTFLLQSPVTERTRTSSRGLPY